jgi:nitrite reductase/ring-hydroxylating ferredoxin subunit
MTHDVTVGPLDNFVDGQLVAVEVEGRSLILARDGGEVHVAVNKCPHLGFSLTKGPAGLRYTDGVVSCPWHNSSFNVCTGENLDWVSGFAGREIPKWSRGMVRLGRKPHGLTTVPAQVVDGVVTVSVD